MFERAKQEFGGQVEVVCPGAGVYEPVRLASSITFPPWSPGFLLFTISACIVHV